MILVRVTMQAKWGKVAEVVALMRDGALRAEESRQSHTRLLTDLSGEFNTVVLESQHESLAAWERWRVKMFASPAFQQAGGRLQELVISGRQEFYTIEAQS